MKLDPAVASALSLSPNASASVSRHGGSEFSTTAKITVTSDNGVQNEFFLKTAAGPDAEVMFRGEHTSLNAIHQIVPSLCPKSYAHGLLANTPGASFLVTDFLNFTTAATEPPLSSSENSNSSRQSFAAKLGKLHTTPAPIPEGFSTPVFGFPVPTCCGNTPQPNTYKASWPEFYADNRLLAVLATYETAHGQDAELRTLVESVAHTVVPALLRDHHHHQSNGHRIVPVVVHGDLWSGNRGRARIGRSGPIEDVVFDPSACYASSEYEWGIMRMFGGFGAAAFADEYHALCPRLEPLHERDDRLRLYELYHHLNHAAIFGNSYRAGAVAIMRGLLRTYGGR